MKTLCERHTSPCGTKLDNFERYVRRQQLARFLARYELFKMTIDVKGSIIECGVHNGGGLFAWAKLSAALEPMAIHRKVIGFDTFEGFPALDKADLLDTSNNSHLRQGGFSPEPETYIELQECIADFDSNRFLNQFDKIQMIKGDATHTIPQFTKDNSHLLVSLLFLDFDIYEPTKVALEQLMPRMPRGAVIAFDEINNSYWKGETNAMLKVLGDINQYQIEKFPFDPNIAYIKL